MTRYNQAAETHSRFQTDGISCYQTSNVLQPSSVLVIHCKEAMLPSYVLRVDTSKDNGEIKSVLGTNQVVKCVYKSN